MKLGSNELTNVDFLKELKALNEIDVGDNRITDIPLWLPALKEDSKRIIFYLNFDNQRVPVNSNAQKCFQLGVNLREDGDWIEAAKFIKQAAEMDHAEAQINFALMCMRGDGVRRSESEGLIWMQKAANNGFQPAKNNVEILKKTDHI